MRSWRYEEFSEAGEVYEEIRDYLLVEDVDASVYRLLLNGVPYVVVVGDGPLTNRFMRYMHEASRGAEVVSLPLEVREHLLERHSTGRIPGVFWERRSLDDH